MFKVKIKVHSVPVFAVTDSVQVVGLAMQLTPVKVKLISACLLKVNKVT